MFSKLLYLKKDRVLLLILLFLLVNIFCMTLIIVPQIYALTMSNNDYLMQMNTLDNNISNSTNPSKIIYPIIIPPAKVQANIPSIYIVKGFQYLPLTDNFKFSISSQFIDFGKLSATNPVTRTQILTITEGSSFGYVVMISEDHLLQIPSTNKIIPDTTCDTGTCSELTAGAWTSSLTYGLGYRCDNILGLDCDNGFLDQTYYKQFPNISALKNPQIVLQGLNQGITKKAEITYKVNISATQPEGQYMNTITYMSIPNF